MKYKHNFELADAYAAKREVKLEQKLNINLGMVSANIMQYFLTSMEQFDENHLEVKTMKQKHKTWGDPQKKKINQMQTMIEIRMLVRSKKRIKREDTKE